jgi:hypothetical protein
MVLRVSKAEKTCQESIARIEKGALSVTQSEAMISKTRELFGRLPEWLGNRG